MSAPVRTYKLEHPIHFGEELIEELEFREPIARDLNDLPVGELTFGALVRLGARLAGKVPTALDSMKGRDALAVANVMGELLGGGPATGGSS